MKRGHTREQLDEDSVSLGPFPARAWEREAWAFCEPVREVVGESLLHGWGAEGEAAALEFLRNPGPPVPLVGREGWRRAFRALAVRTNKEAVALATRLRELASADARAEVVVPLLIASIDRRAHGTEMRWAFQREKWPRGVASAAEVLVACAMIKPDDDASRAAIEALARLGDAPVAARAALWIATTRDPTDDAPWKALARLDEPGALALGLAEGTVSFDSLPARPATTKALARIVLREDPWFEPRVGKPRDEWSGEVLGAGALARALYLLPWAARKLGGVDVALDALRRATGADAGGRAVGRALLGDVDALPSIERLLDSERVGDGVFEALAALGPVAGALLPRLARFDSPAARVARAAISGVADESLADVIERELEQASRARALYDEGVVTPEEFSRTLWCIDVVLRLWLARGVPSPWAQSAMDAAVAHARAQHDVASYPWTATLASLV